jgi:hypothetical protein
MTGLSNHSPHTHSGKDYDIIAQKPPGNNTAGARRQYRKSFRHRLLGN